MEIVRADLLNNSPKEVMEWLASRGIAAAAWQDDGGMHIVTDGNPALETASFVPAESLPHEPRVPEALRTHLPHLRDYMATVRANGPVTGEQTAHVVADIISALEYLNAQIRAE